VYDTRHLGGNSGHCLAAEIGIVTISRDVAFEFMSEAVLTLADGNLPSNPQGSSQPRVAEFGKSGLAAILTRLLCRQVQPAEFEKLTVMMKAAQVPSLRNYR